MHKRARTGAFNQRKEWGLRARHACAHCLNVTQGASQQRRRVESGGGFPLEHYPRFPWTLLGGRGLRNPRIL